MDADIKIFFNTIKEKTGIDFSIFSKSGEFLAGIEKENQLELEKVHGIQVDKDNNKTLFSINYKSKEIIGIIYGCGKAEENYAYLISELSENYFHKEVGLSRAEFLKATVLGQMTISQIVKYTRKFSIQDMPGFVMLINVDSAHMLDTINIVNNCLEQKDFSLKIDDEQLGVVKFMAEDGSDYQSPTEFAEFVKQTIYEEMGINIVIAIGGVVKTIAQLSNSFSQAISAFRMFNILGSKGDIHSFKEYVLIKMLEDLPKYKLNENLEMLMDSGAKEIFSDEEMISTAEEFLENSLNTSETSRKLYLHRNTLIYRLDKIEKATGLNIRKFSDAITFRLITILSRLVK